MTADKLNNNSEQMLKHIFDNIEKILRYLVPAYVFNILLKHFETQCYDHFLANTNSATFALYFILEGLIIYSLHRVVFEALDFILACCGKRKMSRLISASCRLDDKTTGYLYYKMATVHSALLTTELVIPFLVIYVWPNNQFFLFFFATLFVVSFYVYCRYHYIQAEIYRVEESSQKIG